MKEANKSASEEASKTERLSVREAAAGTEILETVREFLLKNGYFQTLDKFQEETQSQGASIDAYVAQSDRNFRFGQSLLLEASQD